LATIKSKIQEAKNALYAFIFNRQLNNYADPERRDVTGEIGVGRNEKANSLFDMVFIFKTLTPNQRQFADELAILNLIKKLHYFSTNCIIMQFLDTFVVTKYYKIN
jgi:hypothetical protein